MMTQNYVIFGEFNTSEHGLILTREEIGRPQTTARSDALELYGLPDFDDYDIARSRRNLSFEFVLYDGDQWPAVYGALSTALEGVKCKVVRALEPSVFYLGRCSIDPFKTSRGRGIITVNVDAEPFKYSATYNTVTMTNQLTKTVTFDTDYVTPAVITITPANALTDLTLTSFAWERIKRTAEPIILGAMAYDEPVVIDGEKHLVTVDGASAYASIITQMWEWPAILPGRYKLTISNKNANIEIKYRGRFI